MRRLFDGGRTRACLTGGGIAVLAALAGFVIAQPTVPRFDPRVERRITLDDVMLEAVRVESQLQGWALRKICLDGQAYWVGFSEMNPTALTVAYKDGRPEPCGRRG